MRRPFVAGNWKMNLTRSQAVELARQIGERSVNPRTVELAVFPPSVYLDAVAQELRDSQVGWGAQTVYFEAPGAFTGEISTTMLVDLGCKYVILGHSERRHVMGETDRDINQRVLAALAAKLIPIVCVGETLEQRESGQTRSVVEEQFRGSLAGLSADQVSGIVLAYEPVWAIGTGKVATPVQAEEVHADLRSMLQTGYNSDVAAAVRIQYGGSVKPENAAELLAQDNIDGALVGGASLDAESFLAIAAAS